MGTSWTCWITVTVLLVAHEVPLTSGHLIGVCYGTQGDNLPSPTDVINLYKRSNIEMIRLFEPLAEVLEALRGSNLLVSLGVRNEDLQSLSSSQDAANAWVGAHIVPYKNDVSFGWVTLGNEVIPGPESSYVASAMTNIHNALLSNGLDRVKVTTVVPGNALATSYPPSAGAFSPDVLNIMKDIATFLYQTGAPLMVNVYPYFAYSADPTHISLDYAMFNGKDPIIDGNYQYFSLFEAMVDAFNAALEKINAADVPIAVSESGWPSSGNEPYTSITNAQTYNANLMKHVIGNGTPRKPDHLMDTFMFAMFNEDLKAAGVEQNFGFFYPNMQPVYPFW
ncbi:hypothetical protein HHK36_004384 [Tetracentron sinense]|uniref:Glucan endo-1,3-beta-D-glucosidase n=1 Tax=Tetracentron sinense TaxID=13715 RepID=A0A834ZUC0_TETSI|nr:hypothetical protein HHK36_004384 [Tetracentron sinense]